jgi:hypothetical protein
MSTHLSQEEEMNNLGEAHVNTEAAALEDAPDEAVLEVLAEEGKEGNTEDG